MHDDFHPYYVRVGDQWTKIDYGLAATQWMKPLVRGQETDLIEIPANWYLDDLPPMMFIKKSPNSHGFVNPRTLEQMWRDQFDWIYREYDYAVFTMTIHPDVSGRPQVLLMHERLIAYINQHEGVYWLTFEEIAHARGEDVLRVKGLLNVGATGPVVLNGVQHLMHPPEHLEHWPGEDQRSHLVFILHAIEPDAIVRSLQAFQPLLGAHPTVDEVGSHL